jgi:hypothetical protein
MMVVSVGEPWQALRSDKGAPVYVRSELRCLNSHSAKEPLSSARVPRMHGSTLVLSECRLAPFHQVHAFPSTVALPLVS